MFIPVSVIVGILAYIAGVGSAIGFGLWSHRQQEKRWAATLIEAEDMAEREDYSASST